MAKMSGLRCGRSEWRRRLQPVLLILPLALGACATLEEVMQIPKGAIADAAAAAPPESSSPGGPVALAPKLAGTAAEPVRVAAAKPIAAAPAEPPASAPIAAVPLPPPPAAKPEAAAPPAPVAAAKPAAPVPAAGKEAPPVRAAAAETTAVAASAAGAPPAAGPTIARGKETACPAGTFGMWGKPDVIGQEVYICRSLASPPLALSSATPAKAGVQGQR